MVYSLVFLRNRKTGPKSQPCIKMWEEGRYAEKKYILLSDQTGFDSQLQPTSSQHFSYVIFIRMLSVDTRVVRYSTYKSRGTVLDTKETSNKYLQLLLIIILLLLCIYYLILHVNSIYKLYMLVWVCICMTCQSGFS